ncbi:hypothetical protein AMJ86_04765 [bacterium SM23_57]|nr:MAG: hypothetical protein AMJ86_04765 [bacterium SM23_57]
MMTEAIEAISNNPEITTRELANIMGVDQQELFYTLNDEANGGNLIRHMVFVENGTSRPTLCFGWSCPTL